MSPHPNEATFQDFVSGLPVDAAFEDHVVACTECAARLRDEAAADMALFVAATTRAPRRKLALRWVPVALAAGLSLFAVAHRVFAPAAQPRFAWSLLDQTPDDAARSAPLPVDEPASGDVLP
jgi:hypothetical protein